MTESMKTLMKALLLAAALVMVTALVGGKASAADAAEKIQEGAEQVGQYVDDAGITTLVKGKFLAEKGLDSLDISVETVDGTVTLSGVVESDAQISLAERVANTVEGVKKVDNKLTAKN